MKISKTEMARFNISLNKYVHKFRNLLREGLEQLASRKPYNKRPLRIKYRKLPIPTKSKI